MKHILAGLAFMVATTTAHAVIAAPVNQGIGLRVEAQSAATESSPLLSQVLYTYNTRPYSYTRYYAYGNPKRGRAARRRR